MATTLSSLISDTPGWLICQRLALAALFGQPRKNFQRNHSMFLKPNAFRGCDRFTATVSIRQRHASLVTKDEMMQVCIKGHATASAASRMLPW
jgi:hypothetical protein